MQPMTIEPKLTKKYLMAVMRKQRQARTFNRDQFKKQYGLDTPMGDRNVRRYMNQIADEFGEVKAEELIFLKKVCIDNLMEKALSRELDEGTECKIALSGETSKLEVKQDITERQIKIVRMWQPDATIRIPEGNNP
jgi:hypothetical protein